MANLVKPTEKVEKTNENSDDAKNPKPGDPDYVDPAAKTTQLDGSEGKGLETTDHTKGVGENALAGVEDPAPVKDAKVVAHTAAVQTQDFTRVGIVSDPHRGTNREGSRHILPNPTEPHDGEGKTGGGDITGRDLRNPSRPANLGEQHPNDVVRNGPDGRASSLKDDATKPGNEGVARSSSDVVWPNYQSDVVSLKEGTKYYAWWLHDPTNTDEQRYVENNISALSNGSIVRRGLPSSYWQRVTGAAHPMPPVFVKGAPGTMDWHSDE